MKLLTPIGIILVCVAMYFMYTSPMSKDVRILSQQKNRYEDVLEKTKELSSIRDKVLIDYNSIPQTDIDRLSKVVPATFNTVLFINDLNALASRYSLVLSDFKTADQNNSDGVQNPTVGAIAYKSHLVSFRLKGEYSNFVDFLKNLESGLQLVDVMNLTLNSFISPGQDGDMDYTLELNTYSLK